MALTRNLIRFALAGVLAFGCVAPLQAEGPPKAGDEAADFELKTLKDKSVKLSELVKSGPVVVVVLRGYPGYQCPICSKQVGELVSKAKAFKDAKASVVLIYPGPGEKLTMRADEFIQDTTLPDNFHLVTDPGYTFVNAYHLRWDAPRETAYPATFVVDRDRKVVFAKVSKTHGGRSSVMEVLKALPTTAQSP